MKQYKPSLINLLKLEDFIDKSDEELKELLLECVKDFRYHNRKYECPICFKEFEYETSLKIYAKCHHKCCVDCWKDVLHYQLNNLTQKLHCFECLEETYNNNLIWDGIITIDEFNEYCSKIYRIVFNNVVQCPNCNREFWMTDRDGGKCPNCLYHMCGKCLNAEHKSINMTCKEFDSFMLTNNYIKFIQLREKIRLKDVIRIQHENKFKDDLSEFKLKLQTELQSEINIRRERKRQEELRKNELETQKWLKENTKQCPKCGGNIYKNGGCNHMTCKFCKHEFCWICGATYTNNHFSSTSKCKQFDDGFRGDDYGIDQYLN
jgi:hypothetical protein